jgi:hypothetical protein
VVYGNHAAACQHPLHAAALVFVMFTGLFKQAIGFAGELALKVAGKDQILKLGTDALKGPC